MDGLWYCFDDSDVQQLPEEEVCTQAAYILFYQRRTAIPAWSANSSVAGEAGCGTVASGADGGSSHTKIFRSHNSHLHLI